MITKQAQESNITITLNEQMATKLIEAMAKALSCTTSSQTEEFQTLQKTNAALQEKLTLLEQKLANLEAQSNSSTATKPSEPISQVALEPKPQAQQTQPLETKPQESELDSEDTAKDPDPEKAEKWAFSNQSEWLDKPCPFKKATGRTWRQLGQNIGSKIEVKGKPAQPRAYLHSIETWQSCKVWYRMKAKVALLVCKNGNGNGTHSHYSHPVEIGA